MIIAHRRQKAAHREWEDVEKQVLIWHPFSGKPEKKNGIIGKLGKEMWRWSKLYHG